MEPETVEQVTKELRRKCRHERCIGRNALIEVAARLMPETAEWLVQQKDDRMRLYAIHEGVVHEAGADCRAVADQYLDDPESADCDYGAKRLTGTETFACRVERTEQRDSNKTKTSWCFTLTDSAADKIEIEYESQKDDAEGADGFARGLVREILAAPIAI